MTTQVLVLNASYEPLHKVSVPHAIRMLIRNVAEVHEAYEGRTIGKFSVPKILRLFKYISQTWFYNKRLNFSKGGILLRDDHKCCYCGKPATTIDHLVPRARGGKSTWQNCVSACKKCNEKKADRSILDLGWKMLYRPYEPRFKMIFHDFSLA